MFSEWKTRLRDERDSEFAPPSAYFNEKTKQKPERNKNHEKQSKMFFKWSEDPKETSEKKDEQQSTTAPLHPQPPQTPPTAPQPQTSSGPDQQTDTAPVSAPSFTTQFPPPMFYPPFPPQFSGPPPMFPPFPPQYPNQYLPHYPPQYQAQSYPQPQRPPVPAQQPTDVSQPHQSAQSIDDMLSFYRNSSWSLKHWGSCQVGFLNCEFKTHWGRHRKRHNVSAF